MSTAFVLPRPDWASETVWYDAITFANSWADSDTPPAVSGVGPGIQRVWRQWNAEQRFEALANSYAAQHSEGTQFGGADIGPIIEGAIIVAIGAGLGALVGGGGISGGIGDLASGLGGSITESENAHSDTIDSVLRGIGEGNSAANAALSNVSANAINLVANTSAAGQQAFNHLSESILSSILNKIGASNDTLSELLRGNIHGIDDLIRVGKDHLEDLAQQSLGNIDSTLKEVLQHQDGILGKVGDALSLHLTKATDANKEVSDKIIEGLDEQLKQSRENADAARGDFGAAIAAITVESDSSIQTVGRSITATGEKQAAATTEAGEKTAGGLLEINKTLNEAVLAANQRAVFGTDSETVAGVSAAIASALEKTGCPENASAVINAFMTELFGRFTTNRAIAQALDLTSAVNAMMGPVYEVLGNCVAQAAARLVPTSLATAPELRDQRNRGLLSQQDALNDLLSQGYNLERALNLLETRHPLIDVGLVQTWYLRGFTSLDESVKLLAAHGLKNDEIENILRMAFFIPPVQDLITMAVREVFSPAIAERFGQFDDFPEEFEQFARLQGVDADWAKRYWAAHWSLPSAGQGFEMYQREIISEKDLDLLLRSLDIMPFWRDNLKDMAYRPLPRVDIRRMHALGLIKDGELQKHYQHFGFSPKDAGMMAEFTRRMNKTSDAVNSEELTGITKSMALSLYKQGSINETQTREILVKAKVSKGAQDVLIQDARVDVEIAERKEQTALLIDQAKAGSITFSQAADQLNQIGLEAIEVQRALVKLERARATATKLPSHPDLDKLHKGSVIGDNEYLTTMQLIGYSESWSEKFLKLAKQGD